MFIQITIEGEFERNIFMIGNMTLLESQKNSKDAANKIFESKKLVYQSSKYVLSNALKDHDWTSQNIKHRQAHLAKLATSIWKIQF